MPSYVMSNTMLTTGVAITADDQILAQDPQIQQMLQLITNGSEGGQIFLDSLAPNTILVFNTNPPPPNTLDATTYRYPVLDTGVDMPSLPNLTLPPTIEFWNYGGNSEPTGDQLLALAGHEEAAHTGSPPQTLEDYLDEEEVGYITEAKIMEAEGYAGTTQISLPASAQWQRQTGQSTVSLSLDQIINNLGQLMSWLQRSSYVDSYANQGSQGTVNISTASQEAISLASNAYQNEGYDPLIVSLGSGGVQLTSLQGGTQFDLQDTGFAQQTAWLANSNEGFLVVDPNNDAITNGSQLLGQNTVLPNGTVASSGFQALEGLSHAQTQASGVLTDSDPLFSELRILESNGTLLTLQQAGITSINLTPENTDVTDQYGNQQLDIGSFTFVNGNTGFMGDYALVHDTQLSTTESTLPVSAAVAALPNVPGSGIIPSLQQAMMHDTTGNLQSLVEQFIASTDPTTQSSILDEIMTAWAGAPNSDVQPDEHITVVENLMGETFTNAGPAVTGNSLGIAVEGAYQLFKESTWAQLMVQSQLSSLFSQITTSVDPDTGITTYDFSGLIQSLQNELQSNYTQGVQDLANAYRAIVDLGMDQNSNFATFYSAFSSNSTLKFAMDTAGKEAYFSATGFTGSIDNTITPNLYIDLTANDYSGPVFAGIDDVIFFDKNNGPVSLEEGNDETIVLGSDVSSNDVYFTSNDDVEVVMHFFDSNATLTLGAGVTDYGWTNQSASQQITAIQFVDGTQITGNDLLNDISAYANQNQDLNRVGITINETDYASGSDSVYAGSGQDTVVGGTGTESLYAGSGQDTLIAGTGNTTMYGGAGTDTFVFGPGNGVASIIEPTTSSAKSDLLEVNDTLTDTTFTESGNNLILTLASGDQIMLQNELTQQDVQEFSFSDGNVLALSDIESGLVTLNAPSGQSTFIAPDNSYIIQGTGNETIFTKDGNDTVYGNGNSTINLGAGTDTVDAGPGVSTISGGDGNAAIIFNQGDGQQTLNLNGNNNLISFGSGITASDLQFSAEGTALAIGFANSNDEILVTSQFANASVNTFNFSDGSQLSWQTALQGIEITGTAPGDTINDSLSTSNDIIQGAGGNETILLGTGNDTVLVGQGNTSLTSGSGSDTIIFQPGDGQLTVSEPQSGIGEDTLVLGQGLTAGNVAFTASGNDLVLSSGNDQIVLENALGSGKQVSSIVFGDGTTLSLSEVIGGLNPNAASNNTLDPVEDQYLVVTGTNDQINTSGNDVVVDQGGNATVALDAGNDYVYAGPGSNTITAGSGNDIIATGTGSTVINTGTGNDTIVYNAGDGAVQINESSDPQTGASDVVQFGAGISLQNLEVSSAGENLILTDGVSGDSLTLQNGMSADAAKQVHQFLFADGSSISLNELLAAGITVNSSVNSDDIDRSFSQANETITASGNGDTITSGSGYDTIIDTGSNADIVTGNGNDSVSVAGGNNTIQLGNGYDTVTVSTGNDTIQSGYGSNTIYVNAGGGSQEIIEPSDKAQTGNSDTVIFGAGLNESNIYLNANPTDLNDLVINFYGSSDQVIIDNALNPDASVAVGEFVFNDGTVETLQQILDVGLQITVSGNDQLEDFQSSASNDQISVPGNSDHVLLGSGDDQIGIAGTENYIVAESGNDTISLGMDNTYQVGAGHSLIEQLSGNDTIDGGSGKQVSSVVFGDGTTLSLSEITAGLSPDTASNSSLNVSRDQYLVVTGENDQITATGNDVIDDQSGNATVTLGSGNDYVYAGPGNNTITAGSGSDIISTGVGNSVINTGTGNDTIVYNLGNGALQINESSDPQTGASDVVEFGAGISLQNLAVSFVGENIVISDGVAGDSLTLSGRYKPSLFSEEHTNECISPWRTATVASAIVSLITYELFQCIQHINTSLMLPVQYRNRKETRFAYHHRQALPCCLTAMLCLIACCIVPAWSRSGEASLEGVSIALSNTSDSDTADITVNNKSDATSGSSSQCSADSSATASTNTIRKTDSLPSSVQYEYQLFGLTQAQLEQIAQRYNESLPANSILTKAYVEPDGSAIVFSHTTVSEAFEVRYSSNGTVERVRRSFGACTFSVMDPWLDSLQAALYKAACEISNSIEEVQRVLSARSSSIPLKGKEAMGAYTLIDDYTVLRNEYHEQAKLFNLLDETAWAKRSEVMSNKYDKLITKSMKSP